MTRLGRTLFSAIATNVIAFSQPVRFSEALESTQVRSVVATTLSSAELAKISEDILERARFSARTSSAEYLDEWDRLLDRYLSGDLDKASFRSLARQKLDRIGYSPAPDEAGSITDLGSDLRLNLRIEMDAQFARGYGTWKHDQAPVILDAWPAQELFRAAAAEQPRNWATRWQDAGGELFDGRMIALRNSPIWTAISRFNVPYPPFDYGSHMRTRLIARKKAMELGLIDRDTIIPPEDRGFNDDLRMTPDIRSTSVRQALLESDARYEFQGDVLTLKEAA